MEHFDDQKVAIKRHLQTEYGYSEEKAKKAVEYLMRVPIIAFEYSYFISHGDFVPDQYASTFSGYTAKGLCEGTGLTVLGAFNFMVYLKQNPDEALVNLNRDFLGKAAGDGYLFRKMEELKWE
jgi:hypothetical protein